MEFSVKLKAPVTTEQLDKEWSQDCVVDRENVDLELIKIPILHAKYMAIWSHHRHVSLALEEKYKEMRDKRTSYYKGEMCLEDLQKENWDQFQGICKLPSDIARRLETDPILTKLLLKKQLQDEIVNYSDRILKSLNNRSYELKALVDYIRFCKGN